MKVDTEFNRLVFPPEIYSTPQRPDIVIWSASIKVVLLLELTCPAEENFDKAHLRKEIRYSDLCHEINNSTGWRAQHHPFEVGARGFVARSTRSLLILQLSEVVDSKESQFCRCQGLLHYFPCSIQ